MTQLHLHIHGRVQGVSYRANAAARARELGLSGWVRNCHDGHVELLAEGEMKILERLLDWCRQGPRFARVDKVDARWSEETEALTGFQIAPDA